MNEENPSLPPQAQNARSKGNTNMDFFAGVIWPLVMLLLDPMLLKISPQASCGGPSLGWYAAYYIYPAVLMGALLLFAWLFARDRLSGYGAFLAGIFGLGSVLASALGISLTVFCFMAIGPGYIYFRNAVLAWKLAKEATSLPLRIGQAVLGIVIFLLVSWAIGSFLLQVFPPVVLPACAPSGE